MDNPAEDVNDAIHIFWYATAFMGLTLSTLQIVTAKNEAEKKENLRIGLVILAFVVLLCLLPRLMGYR